MSGLALTRMFVSGPRHACTRLHHCLPSTCPMLDSTQFTLILSVHFRRRRDIHIYLHVLTVLLVGQKPFQSLISQQKQLQVLLSAVGSQDLVYHPQSLQTEDHSSSLLCGHISCSCWELNEIRTTAYPIANGLVERFHRQLKAALKSQPNHTHWSDSIPMVLLGIRTALKDIQCSAAELVYGTTLRLPGEFFDNTQDDMTTDPAAYVTQLKSDMRRLQATPTRPQDSRKVHIHPELSTCTHVFVHHDATRRTLQAPYDGPYKVLQRANTSHRM